MARRTFGRFEVERKETVNSLEANQKFGGREEIRTPDPLLAKQVLSQLSYTPTAGTPIDFKAFVTVRKQRLQRGFPNGITATPAGVLESIIQRIGLSKSDGAFLIGISSFFTRRPVSAMMRCAFSEPGIALFSISRSDQVTRLSRRHQQVVV